MLQLIYAKAAKHTGSGMALSYLPKINYNFSFHMASPMAMPYLAKQPRCFTNAITIIVETAKVVVHSADELKADPLGT